MGRALVAMIMFLGTFNAAYSGPYVEGGFGVQVDKESAWLQEDGYGILAFGYAYNFDEHIVGDISFQHRSSFGRDTCGDPCWGDNTIETKLRMEW